MRTRSTVSSLLVLCVVAVSCGPPAPNCTPAPGTACADGATYEVCCAGNECTYKFDDGATFGPVDTRDQQRTADIAGEVANHCIGGSPAVDGGVTNDAGSIIDSGVATDAGSIIDSGVTNDAGNATADAGDAGDAQDSGSVVDGGSVDAGPLDAGPPLYVGRVDNAGSDWSALTTAAGAQYVEAGHNACTDAIGAPSHVCDYTEVVTAEGRGELADLATGTTAWLERTTAVTVDGGSWQPGAGGNCVDWSFTGNHIADGEYISFDAMGVPTYFFDNDAIFDNTVDHIQAGLPCGGIVRSILCCRGAP